MPATRRRRSQPRTTSKLVITKANRPTLRSWRPRYAIAADLVTCGEAGCTAQHALLAEAGSLPLLTVVMAESQSIQAMGAASLTLASVSSYRAKLSRAEEDTVADDQRRYRLFGVQPGGDCAQCRIQAGGHWPSPVRRRSAFPASGTARRAGTAASGARTPSRSTCRRAASS